MGEEERTGVKAYGGSQEWGHGQGGRSKIPSYYKIITHQILKLNLQDAISSSANNYYT